MPTLSEFSDADVPLREVTSFLDVTGRPVAADRPYAWSNTVRTLGPSVKAGTMGFEPDRAQPPAAGPDVALKHVPGVGRGAAADWRLVAAGWSNADAVLVSGAILRDENADGWVVSDPDLLEHRKSVLRRSREQPVQAVLSRNCEFDFGLPVFRREDVDVVVLTSKEGRRRGEERAARALGGSVPRRLRFVEFVEGATGIDLRRAFEYLRKVLGVEYLDVACGGSVLRQLIDLKLLDELRCTVSGAFAGSLSSSGQPRPTQFAEDDERHRRFSKDDCPLVRWIGIRTLGEHHIFLRGEWMYRH
ncbi:MAG: hypothetical protein BJ554DRAFT_7206 [Olpidium bornovanus]|uniref:2,5-diamino-6-ribosylamino-4(3H)-pyrimidinone 5'-phosphate reductase n=1 Tax=Olpidium bornovanus TaxID=278681 RepID=A0A8H7ZW86_9FUNG|nr:MAG: hypothetical protein BJ554DRAFT_7206 [Olpidium bornovanus]